MYKFGYIVVTKFIGQFSVAGRSVWWRCDFHSKSARRHPGHVGEAGAMDAYDGLHAGEHSDLINEWDRGSVDDLDAEIPADRDHVIFV